VIGLCADTLFDVAQECSTEDAVRLAREFPWLASALAELMLAHHQQPPNAWLVAYQRDLD
jgi:hypothetical protein